MRILLTGATGLIGKELGKLLSEAGHELIVLTRDAAKAETELPYPAKVMEWKTLGEAIPSRALDGVEAIVNLAGEPVGDSRWTSEKKQRIRDSRVIGTRLLVDAIEKHPDAFRTLKTFVQASAIGVYSDQGNSEITEESPSGNGFMATVVKDWEAEARSLLRDERFSGLRMPVIRTGVVFSRHGGALAKMLPYFRKGLGGKLGTGQQWMSWIHIDDIANLFLFCLENPKVDGVVNGVAPEPVRNERFTIELARSIGRPVFLPVPETALKVGFGSMAATVLESARVVPRRVQEFGFKYLHPDLKGGLKHLMTPLREGQFELLSEQWVPRPPEDVFEFFGDEKNLRRLAPSFLRFEVLGKSTPRIQEGTRITYRLKLRGVPIRWITEIASWQPNRHFMDVQLSGPYRKWHHSHRLIPFAGGTLLVDLVHYKLPLGFVGEVVAGEIVGRDLKSIFDYRRKAIHGIFGKK